MALRTSKATMTAWHSSNIIKLDNSLHIGEANCSYWFGGLENSNADGAVPYRVFSHVILFCIIMHKERNFSMHMAMKVKHSNGMKHSWTKDSLISIRKLWHQASPIHCYVHLMMMSGSMQTSHMFCFVIPNADLNCRIVTFLVTC